MPARRLAHPAQAIGSGADAARDAENSAPYAFEENFARRAELGGACCRLLRADWMNRPIEYNATVVRRADLIDCWPGH